MKFNYAALLPHFLRGSVSYVLLFIILILSFSSCNSSYEKNKSLREQHIANNIFDSITSTPSLSNSQKESLISKIQRDSLYTNLLFDLSYHYYSKSDSLEFRYWNDRTRELAIDKKELMASVNWDLGNFFYRENIIDSSYYHYYQAYKQYKDFGNTYYAARMQLNMGILQEHVKDYIGSEVTTVQAIQTFEKLNKRKQLYIAYSNLGVVFNGLDQYNEAIGYHQKALDIAGEIDNYELKATSLNNLGVVLERKKNYDSAVYYYEKALRIDSISTRNPRVYAMLLDNLAFSRFKQQPAYSHLKLSHKALKIRDSIEHASGIIINNLHLAEMQQDLGRNDSAYVNLEKARSLAEAKHNYDYLLQSLTKLSEVDPETASVYFQTYQKLNDSLLKEERLVRNKFARIRFETDEYIEENRTLTEQQVYLGSAFLVSMLIGLLLYLQKDLRTKNRELLLEKEQQEANEKIYGLILNERVRMEEAKSNERQRISGDLHDGVLGKLFATRISLSLLGRKLFSQGAANKDIYENYISEIQEIEKEIRNISHDLKNDFSENQETFIQLVAELVQKSQNISSINIDLQADECIAWEKLPNNYLIHLYRILQEAIQNAITHSDGKNLTIRFFDMENALGLQISDDGLGFKRKKTKGIGLKNMRERASRLKASFDITSSTKGTIIKIHIPLSDKNYEE